MNQLSQTDYRDIGILLYKQSPEVAIACIAAINRVKPQLYKIELIKGLFTQFCEMKDIAGINSTTHNKTEYVYLRHVFIAVIIKLFNPELLSPWHQFRMKRKLRIELSRVLKTHPTWISQSVNTVCVRLTVYEDFKKDVEEVIKKMEI